MLRLRALFASLFVVQATGQSCSAVDGSGNSLDFIPVRDASPFVGVDQNSNQIEFNMCTVTTGTDCSVAGFKSIATQQGSFGCAILSNWIGLAEQWTPIANGVSMTIQNGDACPDGTLRGITVKFTCDSRSVGPQTFTILETTTCQYEWDFPTYTACGGAPAPAPGPLGPGGGIQDLSLRNFGCGHISCGWMFLILIPLVALVAFGIALPLNKFVLKKDSTWVEAIPLSTLGPLFLDYVRWGGLFVIFNWPCLTQKYEFRRFNLAKPSGFSSSDHGSGSEPSGGYQSDSNRTATESWDNI